MTLQLIQKVQVLIIMNIYIYTPVYTNMYKQNEGFPVPLPAKKNIPTKICSSISSESAIAAKNKVMGILATPPKATAPPRHKALLRVY